MEGQQRDAKLAWVEPIEAAWLGAELLVVLVAGTVMLHGAGLLIASLASLVRAATLRPRRLRPDPLDGIGRAAGQLAVVILLVSAVAADLSRPPISACAWLVGVAVGARVLSNVVERTVRRLGWLQDDVLIVGTGPKVAAFVETLHTHPELGLAPHVLDTGALSVGDEFNAVELIETEAAAVRARRVVLVESGAGPLVARAIVQSWGPRGPRLSVLVEPPALAWGDAGNVDHVWGHPLVAAPLHPSAQLSWLLKRPLDVLISGMAIVAAAPVMAAIAVGVRCTSPGPILFRQERVGLHGRTFTMLKFRSLPVDHDPASGWNAAHTADPTRFGRFMRTTSLDELPQLINVLRGDMSIVGPRPEIPQYAAEFSQSIDGYRWRHRVPVGLTGWAQVHGLRGDTSLSDRARFDNDYIHRWSLRRDLAIMVRTSAQLVPRRAPKVEADRVVEPDVVIDLRVTAEHNTGATHLAPSQVVS